MAANHPDSWWCGYAIKGYVDPADSTAPANGMLDTGSPRGGTSYAPNEWVFGSGRPRGSVQITATAPRAAIPRTFPDGQSNTILFAARNMACDPQGSAAFGDLDNDGSIDMVISHMNEPAARND